MSPTHAAQRETRGSDCSIGGRPVADREGSSAPSKRASFSPIHGIEAGPAFNAISAAGDSAPTRATRAATAAGGITHAQRVLLALRTLAIQRGDPISFSSHNPG